MLFFLCSIAVWRITAALVYEKTFRWLRELVRTHMLDECGQPITLFGKVISCFWCTSWLVSIPFAGCLSGWSAKSILYWIALSGAAILLNHISRVALYAEK